ncbi:hypothetical protein [Gimesia sp.]|uniref:hypothetical protein n=1 Tax=Gimesia sp. TaxID=2024833 RepID=UPI003A9289B5
MKNPKGKIISSVTVPDQPVIKKSPLFELMTLIADDICRKLQYPSDYDRKLKSESAENN